MSAPFMQVYVADYMADTSHLTCEQGGAYWRLLMAMWRAGGTLPEDPAKLARICGLTLARWVKISPDVMAFFTTQEGQISQGRLTKERRKVEEKSSKRSECGKLGGEAKSRNNKKTSLAKATKLPQHLLEPDTRGEVEAPKRASTLSDSQPENAPLEGASSGRSKLELVFDAEAFAAKREADKAEVALMVAEMRGRGRKR